MQNVLKYTSILFFVLYLGQIVERAIPHSHHENEGIVSIDFSGNKNQSEHEEENGEKLHSSFYQSNLADISFCCLNYIQLISFKEIQLKPIKIFINKDFNITPKILSSLLFIIHSYSSKAPPTF